MLQIWASLKWWCNMRYEEERREMIDVCRQAMQEGLFSGTSGNLSLFLPEQQAMLITPTSLRYDRMEPEDIVLLTCFGERLAGEREPSSEWRMHAAVYRAYPETKAIFHTHSPWATAFAACRLEIPAVLIEAHVFLGGGIRCAGYATPGTFAVGENAVPALRDRGGCLLANHGVLTVGESLDQARLRAEYVEDMARIYGYACRLGQPVELPGL